MTPTIALAVTLGITLGVGAWTLLALVPQFGAPRLSRRLAPYLVDVSPHARELVAERAGEPTSVVMDLLGPGLARLRRLLTSTLGGDDQIVRRARQAGLALSVERFRSRQLLAALAGLAVGVLLIAVWSRSNAVPVAASVALVAVCGALGLLAPEQLLARAARRRQARIADELPTVLEFLSLALSAGENVVDALRRVARTGNGELAREFARVVADINAGAAVPDALTRCADAIGLPAFTRTADQLIGALGRGTPLAEVLRAQAADVRVEATRQLMESAGRKEVTMLVPLVFLILPVTIAFALAPAVLVLQIGL
ncbi:type II secretion system F family protein [uncultured Schumannella sp.]|uniref:type II secretion system F family protein n=1 Tax=uncultured Schumannella sp. TaxID=1195956 RepID=UPI0025D4C391|nr:type II secretion system F family protein [uncultured Schumannella sp.]